MEKIGVSVVPAKNSKPVIGLTGGIGSGKSTVGRILESLGCVVLDFDRMAHEELREPEVIATLRSWWGPSVCSPDGEVDRKALAAIVFKDAAKLKRLEDLLYPRLQRRREEIVGRLAGEEAVMAIVLDAPKLHEAGVDMACDVVIFVDADEKVRARRVAADRGWTEAELRRRENLQIPLDKKRALADHVVVNDHSDIGSLRPEIERIFDSVLKSFS